jgi:hypothetical protein
MGSSGSRGRIQGLQLGDLDRREIVYVTPTALYSFTDSTLLEIAVRIPLRGKNFPAGAPLQIGLFHQGDFFD